MPGFDRTGPRGVGPRTGRGLGPCGSGYRCGRGFGYGRGFRRGFYGNPTPLTKEKEKEALKEEKKVIEEELKAVEERIKELEQ